MKTHQELLSVLFKESRGMTLYGDIGLKKSLNPLSLVETMRYIRLAWVAKQPVFTLPSTGHGATVFCIGADLKDAAQDSGTVARHWTRWG